MENKHITVAYKLYTMADGEKELVEEAPAEHPFRFVTGIGFTLESFEKQITALAEGDDFNFTIPCAEAYGEVDPDGIRTLPKSVFCSSDGKFDEHNVFEGNIITLHDNEGNSFYANVGEVTDSTVTIDLNHPHAGKDLIFEGTVMEIREATNKEVQDTMNSMSGCGGCQGGCQGGCGDHDDGCGGGCCGCH